MQQAQMTNYRQTSAQMPPCAHNEIRSWQFSEPPPDIYDTKLQLLTVAGVSVAGYWQGYVGQYFSAWSLDVSQKVC